MEFRVLGPLEVEVDGQVLKLGGAKQRALLALLLLPPTRPSRAIAWSTSSGAAHLPRPRPRPSRCTSRNCGNCSAATRSSPSPRLPDPGQEGTLDLERFEESVARAQGAPPDEACRAAQAGARPVAGAAAGRARRVVRPPRASPSRRAAAFGAGAADRRRPELGRHAQLVPELEGLVREHPLRERLRGQLMLALYRCGRQAEALDVYRTGRRLLDEELGLEPGEELRRLERAILVRDESLAAPASSALAASRTAQPRSRPARSPSCSRTSRDRRGSYTSSGDRYGELLEQHHRLVRTAFEEHGGEEIDSQGDAFFFAFRRARNAVRGAVDVQKRFGEAAHWPKEATVRIRVGIHTGEPGLAETIYHGLDVVLPSGSPARRGGPNSSPLRRTTWSAPPCRTSRSRTSASTGSRTWSSPNACSRSWLPAPTDFPPLGPGACAS